MTQNKHFHKVVPRDLAGKTALQYGLNKKLATMPPGFVPGIADYETFGHFDDSTIFAMGAELENIVAYARCYEHDGIVSKGGVVLPSRNTRTGVEVTAANIAQQPGYDNYKGKGKVLDVVAMDAFIKRHRFDAELMGHIKGQGYELIAALAAPDEQCFFREQGFIHSGLADDCPIYVWNNPEY